MELAAAGDDVDAIGVQAVAVALAQRGPGPDVLGAVEAVELADAVELTEAGDDVDGIGVEAVEGRRRPGGGARRPARLA